MSPILLEWILNILKSKFYTVRAPNISLLNLVFERKTSETLWCVYSEQLLAYLLTNTKYRTGFECIKRGPLFDNQNISMRKEKCKK